MSAAKRKMAFMPYDPEVKELYAATQAADKLLLVVWAYEYSLGYVALFEEYSDDDRVRTARDAAYIWAKGGMKRPEARRYILAAHKAASECGDEIAAAAARAVAHAASTVHSKRHAFGLALYGLTAIAKKYGRESAEVANEIKRLSEGLVSLAENGEFGKESWARFLTKGRE